MQEFRDGPNLRMMEGIRTISAPTCQQTGIVVGTIVNFRRIGTVVCKVLDEYDKVSGIVVVMRVRCRRRRGSPTRHCKHNRGFQNFVGRTARLSDSLVRLLLVRTQTLYLSSCVTSRNNHDSLRQERVGPVVDDVLTNKLTASSEHPEGASRDRPRAIFSWLLSPNSKTVWSLQCMYAWSLS